MSSEFGVRSSEKKREIQSPGFKFRSDVSEAGVSRSAFRVSRFAFLVSLLAAAGVWAQSVLPDIKAPAGWTVKEKPSVYAKADLYGYMDGGAELFFEFGFQDLTVQKYGNHADELALEAYRMADAEGALGIYLIRAGKEIPVKGVQGRSSGDRYQFLSCKDNYFFQVDNFKGDIRRVPDMVRLLNSALASLPKEIAPPPDPLPAENRVPGSYLVLRGPLGLARLATLGEGDILLFKGRATAHAADYQDSGGTHTLVLVRYPDEKSAASAFEYLCGHLDSYLTVKSKIPARLVYKDYQGKFGEVDLEGPALRLRLGMAKEPR
jgi:hypothetical protein